MKEPVDVVEWPNLLLLLTFGVLFLILSGVLPKARRDIHLDFGGRIIIVSRYWGLIFGPLLLYIAIAEGQYPRWKAGTLAIEISSFFVE